MDRISTATLCMSALFAASGCGTGQSGNDDNSSTTVNLAGTTWQIEDIDEAGIVDRSMITLQFPGEGRVAGSTGCNRYFGTVSIDGDRLSFSQLGSTRRACVPALMNQEQRFLEVIQSVSSYRIEDSGTLILRDDSGSARLKGIGIATDPTADSGSGYAPQDAASDTSTRFDCGGTGTVEIRFLGPETIELASDGRTAVLQRKRSASGARYVADGIEFWNKGDEAMFDVDGETYPCTRAGDEP